MGNIFDILGPVMVGPSSSHTAGAVRIGLIARQLFGRRPDKATVYLHGSFADTGKGHGTDKALIAGLLGMKPDDVRIPDSFQSAKEEGMEFTIWPKDCLLYTSDVYKIQGLNGLEKQQRLSRLPAVFFIWQIRKKNNKI